MSDESNMLKEILNEHREEHKKMIQTITKMDKRLELYIQKTEFELKAIKELDAKQNELLAEHSQRSEEIKRDNELKEKELRAEFGDALFGEKGLEPRVRELEKPTIWLGLTNKILLSVAALSGVAMMIRQFLV